MMNMKFSQKHDSVHCIRKYYALKHINNDEAKSINGYLSMQNIHFKIFE